MQYRSYPKVVDINSAQVKDLLETPLHIFPLLDGFMGSIWKDSGEICCKLEKTQDNSFNDYINNHVGIRAFLDQNPHCRLYGIWLVPKKILSYKETAWNKFYICDITEEREDSIWNYIHYDVYFKKLYPFKILMIPHIATLRKAERSDLEDVLLNNNYLLKNESDIGKGIIIKNYDFKNEFGQTYFAKFLSEQYMSSIGIPKVKDKESIEQELVNTHLTKETINLIYDVIVRDRRKWDSDYIDELISKSYKNVISYIVELILVKNKRPIIDFDELDKHVKN